MRKIVFDLESDGLIDECTKIHCLCYYDFGLNKYFTLTNYDDMIQLFSDSKLTAIGHNIIRFDQRVIKKILGIDIKARLVDTLALSWYLYPERDSHSIETWGNDLGKAKPKIENWSTQSLEEYIFRCTEDVKINLDIYNLEAAYLNLLYSNDIVHIDSLINYLMFKLDCAREQEEIKWKLDVEKCKANLEILEKEKEEKYNSLSEAMPKNIVYRVATKPKKCYKQDGSYSTLGEKWFQLLEERGLPEDYEGGVEIEVEQKIGNPNSPEQLKDWLYSLGWKPDVFKYNKNKETQEVKVVEQISLPEGRGLCDSVKNLFDLEPALENLDKYSVISHRIGILKGFLRDVDKNGYLKAQVMGLTNTLRFQHTELVNLPGVARHYGEYIRGVLIAPEGYVLCGSDMSSLEDRTKQHYMYFFDPEYVESMIKPGFDPHLDLAEFAYTLTNGEMGVSSEDVEFYKNFKDENDKAKYKHIKAERHSFKTVNYAAVYGSGAPTMSRSSGMSEEKCKKLLLAYWAKNWSVKKVAKSCKVKTINNQMWLYNPISQFWYSLRYEKDKFSTLNQGTGVFCFDYWIRKVRKKGIKLCGQFHDELVAPVFNALYDRNYITNCLKTSIEELNNELPLNRKLDISIQFGNTYADIH